MNYQLKTDKLTIKNPKASGQSHIYIAPTEMALNSGLGQLFIIVEIKSKEKKIPEILNQIVQELSEYYYHSPTKNAEAALETVCQYFNENIPDISQKNWQWLKEKINIIIAAIQENQLSLSNYNNMKAWLVRGTKIHDISGSDTESKKAVTPKKIMSQIISGQLEDGDVLMLSNATIFDYFSQEKIKKTITTLAPTQACAFLKNALVDYKVTADFSTAIIKLSQHDPQKEKFEPAQANILQGIEMEGGLKQGGGTKIATLTKQTVGNIKESLGRTTSQAKQLINIKIIDKIKAGKNETAPVNRENETKNKLRERLGFGRERFAESGHWLKKMPLKEYRLVIFILIVALLFVGSLKVIGDKKTQSAEAQKSETAVGTIKDKINSVEAALIYKDEAKAQQLLAEVNDLLAKFDYKEGAGKAEYEQLTKQAEQMLNKVYKLERIDENSYFVKLPENVSATSNLIALDSDLYFLNNNNIFKINTKDGTINQIATLDGAANKILALDNKQLVFYNNGTEIFFMDKGQKAAQKKTFTLPDNDQPSDSTIYNKKLYLVGGKNIYSYTYNNGYDKPTAWLKQEISVAGNNAIAVDGNIWLAAANGEISRLFMGKKEKFTLSGLYEPLSSTTKIYTADGLNNLYLLDQEKNRITIANKQGKVLRQVLGDNLDKIAAIVPGAGEKDLYIITVSGVYKLAL